MSVTHIELPHIEINNTLLLVKEEISQIPRSKKLHESLQLLTVPKALGCMHSMPLCIPPCSAAH